MLATQVCVSNSLVNLVHTLASKFNGHIGILPLMKIPCNTENTSNGIIVVGRVSPTFNGTNVNK